MAGYPDYSPPNDAADPAVIEAAVEDYLTLNPPGIPDHNDTTLRDAAAAHPATAITVDASGFNGNLAATDDTVQEIAQKLDDLAIPDLSAHLSDATDAHDASAISIGTLNGNLSAVTGTDVEQALQAVDNLSLGGSVATDALWDAAGDVAYGTGANTATRLALGTRGMALTAGATAPEYLQITPRVHAVPVAVDDWVALSAPYATGLGGSGAINGAGSASASNGAASYVPFFVGKRIGVSGLGIQVVTGNAGGSAVIRMGIHANNAGRPGTVVVDAGTASAAAAAKELTFTEVFLNPGWYFAVVVFQDLDTGGTNPAVRLASAMNSSAPRTSVPASANQGSALTATVTGALADNPTVTISNPFIPTIWLKVSTL